ncbi:MAG TPA: XdhC family protein, partial [Gemmatimonadales bacterium]
GPRKTFTPLAGGSAGPAAVISADGRDVIERFAPAPRVIVFGAGHVGAAIARAAAAAGFRAVVVDDRAEFAAAERFPADVTAVVAGAEDALARFAPGAGDAVVIATRGHREDARILDRVAASPAGYVGLLGSRRKRAVLTAALTVAGVPAAALARVRVPVGLAIGAVTPEEIAVSVVAELIAWRRDPARA